MADLKPSGFIQISTITNADVLPVITDLSGTPTNNIISFHDLLKKSITALTGNVTYDILLTDNLITVGGMTLGATLNFPAPSTCIGKEYIICNINASLISLTLNFGTALHSGPLGYPSTIISYGSSITLISDGTYWLITSDYSGGRYN